MIMKRLALLTITAFLAVVLSACGEHAEKKAEDGAAANAPASQENTGTQAAPGDAGTSSDTTKTGQ
jgi:hypothetical protein